MNEKKSCPQRTGIYILVQKKVAINIMKKIKKGIRGSDGRRGTLGSISGTKNTNVVSRQATYIRKGAEKKQGMLVAGGGGGNSRQRYQQV